MRLGDKIHVNSRYARSANLERDRGMQAVVESYIPTSHAVELLERVLEADTIVNQPRAWSVVGPYGSGKSSFALFLYELLGHPDEAKKAALFNIRRNHRHLHTGFKCQKTWCRIVLIGSDEPLAAALLRALDNAAQAHWHGKYGRKPKVLSAIRSALKNGVRNPKRILDLIDDLQDAIQNAGDGGLLFVIDEMGRFLDYEARNGGNGLSILQDIAERAFRGSDANILLFVFLHQAFSAYARGLGEQMAKDWAKVQGRFETVSFIEAPEQMLRILDAAISNTLTRTQQVDIGLTARKIARTLSEADAVPLGLSEPDVTEIFTSCYPIHPISLLTLPLLCQKFAQNERTLFTYLGSQEPSGFKEKIKSIQHTNEWLSPSAIYDYFIQNQPALLSDPLLNRRWNEVVTAVERVESASLEDTKLLELASELVKAIGILNLVATGSGLKASPTVLGTLFTSENEYEDIIEYLISRSAIQFRRFSGEYRVWQGTDFDLLERTRDEIGKIGHLDLAQVLNERADVRPMVARRHSTRTGTVRYFNVVFADRNTIDKYSTDQGITTVVIYLAETREDERYFEDTCKSFPVSQIWALFRDTRALRSAVTDVVALESLQRSAQELATDPVASREVKERLIGAESAEREILEAMFTDLSTSNWFWSGSRVQIATRRELQRLLSQAMDQMFHLSPNIRNELINRDRPSGQAASARNKLIQQMLSHSECSRLGIEKNPPELTIYRSILENGRLHQNRDGEWQFSEPAETSPINLLPTWRRIDELLAESESEPISLSAMMDTLHLPPYGVRHGVSPILFLVYFFMHRQEIAVYEEGGYSPVFDFELIERMLRRPDNFKFQRFRVDERRSTLLNEYSKALFGETRPSLNVLDVARPLASFIGNLDNYTLQTRKLSTNAIRVRQAVSFSKSPEKLIFKELPVACGFHVDEVPSDFGDSLLSVLRELKNAHPNMLEDMRKSLCESFDLPDGTSLLELREIVRGRCLGLEAYTVDVEGLRSFIRRVSERDQADNKWFSSVLLFLGHKPPEKWSDQDRDAAEYRLSNFSSRLIDLERLRIHHESSTRKEEIRDVILVKTVREDDGEIDEIVAFNSHIDKAIENVMSRLENTIDDLDDEKLRLATIARFTHNFLTRYKNRKTAKRAADHERKIAG